MLDGEPPFSDDAVQVWIIVLFHPRQIHQYIIQPDQRVEFLGKPAEPYHGLFAVLSYSAGS